MDNNDKYYIEIKNKLIDNEVYKRVKEYSINRHDLSTYYEVGKILNDAGKHYGEGIIKNYSIKLTKELGKGYSTTRLKNMRKFYIFFKKSPAVTDKLSMSHYEQLLILNDINAINYYINQCLNNNYSYRKLHEIIKSKEYERLPESTKLKLINKEEMSITDLVKDPIVIKNSLNKEEISEKVLQELIMEDLSSFLEQLGEGFTFIKNEYPIRIENTYNYIDLLLFNIKYNCYVVIELKVTKLKKEHIGQILIYKNYIDEHIKTLNQNKTIGIIVYKEGNKYLLHYSFDNKVFATKYIII